MVRARAFSWAVCQAAATQGDCVIALLAHYRQVLPRADNGSSLQRRYLRALEACWAAEGVLVYTARTHDVACGVEYGFAARKVH